MQLLSQCLDVPRRLARCPSRPTASPPQASSPPALPLPNAQAIDKRRSAPERELHGGLRVLARHLPQEQWEALAEGLVVEQRLRARIAELQEYRAQVGLGGGGRGQLRLWRAVAVAAAGAVSDAVARWKRQAAGGSRPARRSGRSLPPHSSAPMRPPSPPQGLRTFEQVDALEATLEGRRKKGALRWQAGCGWLRCSLACRAVSPDGAASPPPLTAPRSRPSLAPLCCLPAAEAQQAQQASSIRSRINRVQCDDGPLQAALVTSLDAVHAAAALGQQRAMLPDGRGHGMGPWRQ